MTNGFLPPRDELKLPLNLEFQAALVSKFNMPEPPFLNIVRFAACSIV